jgi:hypothetical protein
MSGIKQPRTAKTTSKQDSTTSKQDSTTSEEDSKSLNILAPVASGALDVGINYGMSKLMKKKGTTPLVSKEYLMEGGKQAVASFTSEQLQSWILSILPDSVKTMIGNYTIPAGTGALKLAADMILDGELPAVTDAVVNFLISLASDVIARQIF